jgi:hypothetical protein
MKKFVFIILISIFAMTLQSDVVAQSKPYANPALIYGSDFMSFMQMLRKIGDYNMMLQFTSSESIKKFGKEKIKEYYQSKFTNMSKLKLMSVVSNKNGYKTMNYINFNMATKTATSVNIVIENDTCKLVLPNDLKKKLLN